MAMLMVYLRYTLLQIVTLTSKRLLNQILDSASSTINKPLFYCKQDKAYANLVFETASNRLYQLNNPSSYPTIQDVMINDLLEVSDIKTHCEKELTEFPYRSNNLQLLFVIKACERRLAE